MADHPSERIIIQTEEVQDGASVSEATMARMASTVNFINTKQEHSYRWTLNGLTNFFKDATGLDGAFVTRFDLKIAGIGFFLSQKSFQSLGAEKMEIDLQKITAPGVAPVSIFNTKMSFDDRVPNSDVFLVYSVDDDDFVSDVTNMFSPVKPVFKTVLSGGFDGTLLDEGQAMRFVLTDSIQSAQDASFVVFYRPR